MIDVGKIITDLAWPISLLIAWFAGELGYRWAKLPHISIYAIVGFSLASTQIGLLPSIQPPSILLLANIGFGLILFESGYRINLRWLSYNPWVAASSITEATLTFCLVYILVKSFGLQTSTCLLLASLSMATSPATVVRVINEQRSSGQVTERVLHLSVINCVLAVFLFKVIIGLVVFRTSGNLWEAAYASLTVTAISTIWGIIFGVIMPILLKTVKSTCQDNTLAFACAVILLVILTHNLKLSPVLATLTFGLVSRHGRMVFSPSQPGFGTLGDLLSVLLFVFIAATIEWQRVVTGVWIGLSIITVRFVAKIIGISLFAHISGISFKKGILTGLAMTPISVFVILILEQSRYIGINLVDTLAPLAMVALTLEILGPIMVQRALIKANEISAIKEF
ncbi:TPA: cation:proton antiporter [Legionella pneumophila]|uniref:Sodium:proton antiporter n=1 Tax=Legionella pneumophila subsp. pneumophila TaxID=91891 RepID=A0A3A6VR54_LEGPN|nr:cation:proton antiporter [Legionella pneumophila]ERH43261.1 sodium:proton antiporter [Legionella pneumophila str. Leg01/53]ERH44404.1 sodium:proton antiporter [Legionella pneumophila str. Leg01/11]ERI48136.1 sodium:proton antiporter [Legionella pneumophila str. Leg01/20]AMQ27092.1 sodium:proton antiporter [Legionella pneumophila subsp. pneumophila]AMV13368.1 Sodium/hydrogen exchanger family protein [Legionella pneumophila]